MCQCSRQLRALGLVSLLSLSLCAWALASPQIVDDKHGPKEIWSALSYRCIGPAAGGRVCRVAGVPGDPRLYYAATASGGVWKSSDGGFRWDPIFEKEATATAGSIAVAPTNPNVIYVGSGEANIRSNVICGNGIYKSTDAGKTWRHVWKQLGQIGTIIVHPSNPDIAFAAVLGRPFGPNSERGIYRTRDGGQTWQQVLKKDADTGASDVCFDPSNSTILFAGLWQARRRPWELTSGGPGSGLYVSRDGGDTWTQLKGNGLPSGLWGKVGVAVAPSDGNRVYALIENENGGLFRSDDGGETWRLINGDRRLRQRAWYYSTLAVDPKNPDVVYCPQVPMLRSLDGGKTFETYRGVGFWHGDNHDIWIDPTDPRRQIIGNDGGVNITVNGGKSWYAPPLPISQFYRINVDTRVPYHVSGTMQDIGSGCGPSNSLNRMGIRLGDWYNIGGGETGYTLHDRSDPNIIYAGEYAGIITRYDHRTRSARNVSIYPDNPSGHGAADMRYRFRWPAPIAGSPHDPKVIYHAGNVLFRSTNGGQNWTAISPDLTRNDKSKQKWSGGPITGDNTTAEFYCTISAVAESPLEKGVIWVGSDDGLVHVTRDGGKKWSNVPANLPEFPEWATVKMIEASPHAAGAAYVVIDAHLLDDFKPRLYKTEDYGQTWRTLSDDMDQEVYLHVCRADPKVKGLLFVGSDRGVLMSRDDGKTWESLQLNLPTVPVHDLVVKDNDLVVGTNGRSLWILDNLTPLRQLSSQELEDGSVKLLDPAPVVRWNYGMGVGGQPNQSTFANPPMGAVIDYWLKKPAKKLSLEIRDRKGQLVVRFEGKEEDKDGEDADEQDEEADDEAESRTAPMSAGLHRLIWDLTGIGAKPIPKAQVDLGTPAVGIRVNPGEYEVRLTVDERRFKSKLLIKPDPRRSIPAGDLAEQEKFAMQIRGDLNELSLTVERLRVVRQQLESRNTLLKNEAAAAELREASTALIKKLDELENKLHNPKAKIPYDILALKGGAKLYSKLSFLYNVVLDDEGAPSQGAREVYGQLKKELQGLLIEWKSLLEKDLPKLNELAKEQNWPIVVLPKLDREVKEKDRP
jgi:photosystem II stability/assembly factor-like uncharacterized protein